MTVEREILGHELFQALTADEMERVRGFSTVQSYGKGEIIYHHAALATRVFLNLEGLVYLRMPAKTGEFSVVISRVNGGELFGVAPLLGEERYTATAMAEQPTDLLVIDAGPFREVLQGNQQAALQFMTRVARVYFGRYVEVMRNVQGIVNLIPLIR